MPLPAVVGYAGRVNKDHHPTGKSIANKAALISEGRVVFEQSKMLLPTYDVFDESRYFQPADRQYVYALDNEQLGITICEDVWNDKNFWASPMYARDPVLELVSQGTSILLNISASPCTIDKRDLRIGMLRSIARHHKRPVVYVNQVGGNDSLVFDGASNALTLLRHFSPERAITSANAVSPRPSSASVAASTLPSLLPSLSQLSALRTSLAFLCPGHTPPKAARPMRALSRKTLASISSPSLSLQSSKPTNRFFARS